MSNGYFEFKHFTVHHELCAMKVGTDGLLLGAWANGGKRILDIGSGSGLIALCMAQRFPKADITAIDVDEGAFCQTGINVERSSFKDRITVVKSALQDYDDNPFDAVVCNPPFFKDSLKCPDAQRTTARHADSLTAADLFRHSWRLLSDGGEVSVVIPYALRDVFDAEALLAGLYPSRAYIIRTVERKSPSRCLLAYRKSPAGDVEERQVILNDSTGRRSEWYRNLTKDFYLNNL